MASTSPPRRYQRPLLATDLSADAEATARIAVHVTEPGTRGAIVTVLSKPDLPARIPQELRDEITDAIQLRGRDAEADLEQWARSVGLAAWSTSAPTGRIASTIVHEARVRDADVVIVGSRGIGRVEKGLLGSVSRAVLHRAHADVLVARPRGTNERLRHVLVATDFEEPSIAAAKRAAAIARANDAAVTLLHVLDRGEWMGALAPPEGFDVSTLDKHLRDELAAFNRGHLGGQAAERLVSGRAARTIVANAEELGVDLIVLGTYGGGAVSRALIGSVADAVAERASCSVLVVRP